MKWKDIIITANGNLENLGKRYAVAYNEFSQKIADGDEVEANEDALIELEGLKFKVDTEMKVWLDFDSLKEFLNK